VPGKSKEKGCGNNSFCLRGDLKNALHSSALTHEQGLEEMRIGKKFIQKHYMEVRKTCVFSKPSLLKQKAKKQV
jgi:hypothetical protein